MNTTSMLLGLIFGSIGLGYCIYGKKQSNLVAFVVGLFLMGLPYAIDNNLWLFIISIVLMIVPKFLKI